MAEARTCPRIEISFASRWWFEEYGMDFGEDYWADPIARATQVRLVSGCDGRITGIGRNVPPDSSA